MRIKNFDSVYSQHCVMLMKQDEVPVFSNACLLPFDAY